jgi:hypothetical protein
MLHNPPKMMSGSQGKNGMASSMSAPPRVLHELFDELLARNEQTAGLNVAKSDLNERDCEDRFPKFNVPVMEHSFRRATADGDQVKPAA